MKLRVFEVIPHKLLFGKLPASASKEQLNDFCASPKPVWWRTRLKDTPLAGLLWLEFRRGQNHGGTFFEYRLPMTRCAVPDSSSLA